MNNKTMKQIELKKVEREIKINGELYNVKREQLDEYKESTGNFEEVAQVKGIFHVVKSFISVKSSDATTVRGKGQPMLLTTYENAKNVQNGDIVLINDNMYKVLDKNNIQEYSIIVDISMELILNGNI